MQTKKPREVVIALYEALARRDGTAMGALYHPEATFHDPIFGTLSSKQVAQMWNMLTSNAKDLRFQLVQAEGDGEAGGAAWEATYTFRATGKKVHNRVRSSFQFRDGLIYRQVDDFDLRRWIGMALGLTGRLFGWSTLLQSTVRKNAARTLERFTAKGGGEAR